MEKKKIQPLIFIVQKQKLKLELFLQVTEHNFEMYLSFMCITHSLLY